MYATVQKSPPAITNWAGHAPQFSDPGYHQQKFLVKIHWAWDGGHRKPGDLLSSRGIDHATKTPEWV